MYGMRLLTSFSVVLSAVVCLLDAGCVSSPSYGTVNLSQVWRMRSDVDDGPFYMVNLVQYRDKAAYPDGRATELTGLEADQLYFPKEHLLKIGARLVFAGFVKKTLRGDAIHWDRVAVVRYPSRQAFWSMVQDPEFKKRSEHKEAGLQQSIVMVTHLDREPPRFEPGTLLTLAVQSTSAAAPDGALQFDVEGVLVGDGRTFERVTLSLGQQDAPGTYVVVAEQIAVPETLRIQSAP